jgi:hypothetical protein
MAESDTTCAAFDETLTFPGPVRAARCLLWEEYGDLHLGVEIEAAADLPAETEIDFVLFGADGDEWIRLTIDLEGMDPVDEADPRRCAHYLAQITQQFLDQLGGWSIEIRFEAADHGPDTPPSEPGGE